MKRRFFLLITLAGCGGAELDDPSDQPSELTFGGFSGFPTIELPPVPPVPEALFPEWARRGALANGAETYDYERCETVDQDLINKRTRLTFDQLGAIGTTLNRTVLGGTCNTADCYLRLITSNMGTTVTIGADGSINCEDPLTQTAGTCNVSDSSVLANNPYRGNIVIADRIRIDGTIPLGGLSLILIARSEIELTSNGRLVAFTQNQPKAAYRIAVQEVLPYPQCTTTCVNTTNNPYEPEPECTRRCDTYPEYFQGNAGAAGNNAGSVVMIAKNIRLPAAATGIQPHIQLGGQRGGDGGNLGNINCPVSNEVCASHATTNAKAPGRGGAGGSAGKLITIADSFSGEALRVSTTRGAAGAAGTRALLRIFRNGSVESATYVGPIPAAGLAGANGWRDDLTLQNGYYDYAYHLARRGADRHLWNALHYARNVHPTSEPGRTNKSIARGQLDVVLENYCRSLLLTIVQLPQAPRTTVRASGAPATYLTSAVTTQRSALCTETEARRERVIADLNWFGLPANFLMYLRPDSVATYRGQMVARVDATKTNFNNAATLSASGIADIEVKEGQALAEKRKAAEIATERMLHLGEVVTVSLAKLKRNQQALADTEFSLEYSLDIIKGSLEAAPCDFFCALGQFVQIVVAIASFASNVFSAIEGVVGFIKGLDNIFDTDFLIEQLGSDEAVKFPRDGINSLKILGVYAGAVFNGATTGGEKIPGLSGIGQDVKETIDAWKNGRRSDLRQRIAGAVLESNHLCDQSHALRDHPRAPRDHRLDRTSRSVAGGRGGRQAQGAGPSALRAADARTSLGSGATKRRPDRRTLTRAGRAAFGTNGVRSGPARGHEPRK